MLSIESFDENFVEVKKWGFKYHLFRSSFVLIDVCVAKAGTETSLHFHTLKFNRILVLEGEIELTIIPRVKSKVVKIVNEDNRWIEVTPRNQHILRFKKDTVFIEIDYVQCRDDDIERIN